MSSARPNDSVSGVSNASRARWILSTDNGATIVCDHLIVASGMHARPTIPEREKEIVAGFDGNVLHSSEVRGLASLALQDLVIVGFGNSAADIAMSLVNKGARRVTMCVRSVPPIVRRQWGPLSVEWVSRAVLQHLPPRVADLIVSVFIGVNFGANWWVPHFPRGTRSWGPYSKGRTPVIDKWAGSQQAEQGLVDCIKNGTIRCVGALSGAYKGGVEVGDGGDAYTERVPCSILVFATGFAHTYGDWLSVGLSMLALTCYGVLSCVRASASVCMNMMTRRCLDSSLPFMYFEQGRALL